jgi:hypothetical protein
MDLQDTLFANAGRLQEFESWRPRGSGAGCHVGSGMQVW